MLRKILLGIFILVLVFTQCVSSTMITIDTMEYLKDELLFVDGDVDLSFSSSDIGTEDVFIMWNSYIPGSDITILFVDSREIDYDEDFVNDTKAYYFDDNNSLNEYAILVDYSSIEVPESIEDVLSDIIDELNTRVEELLQDIEDFNTTIDVLTETLSNKQEEIDILTLSLVNSIEENNELEETIAPLKYELNITKADLKYYKSENENLTSDVALLKNRVDYFTGVIDDLKSPTTTFYTIDGVGGFLFSIPNIIIGMILCLILIIYYAKNRNIKLSGTKSTDNKNIANRGILMTIVSAIKFKIFGNRVKRAKDREHNTDSTVSTFDDRELNKPTNEVKNIPPSEEKVDTNTSRNISDIHKIVDVMIQ